MLLIFATTLYVFFSVLLQRFSIMGGMIAVQVFCLFLPAAIFAKWKTGSLRTALRLHAVPIGTLSRVVLLAVTGMGLATLVEETTRPLALHFFGDWLPAMEVLMKILTPRTPQDLLQALCVIGIAAPMCEEVLFRGAFQGTLERHGPVRAIGFSAIMFGLIHFNPFIFFVPILFGVGVGFVAWRTGSVVPSILWHAVNNSLAVIVLYFGGSAFSIPLWVAGGLSVVFVVLFWDFLRHTRCAPPKSAPLATAPDLLRGGVLRFATVAGVACVLLLLGSMTCFGRVKLGNDFLAPDYRAGDFVVYTRGWAFRPEDVVPADVVFYRDSEGGLRFSRVLKTEGERLTMLGTCANHPAVVRREDIFGKAVWKFDLGEEVRKMMRQVDAGVLPAQ